MEKYTDDELWEIEKGITMAISEHPLKAGDNVSMFWYDLHKSIEREIDKRLLASE